MNSHAIGYTLFILSIVSTIFIYLWIGTNKFQKGWRSMVFTPQNMKFGSGFVDVRFFVLIPFVIGIILWKVFFS
jgi:hypothetical protein